MTESKPSWIDVLPLEPALAQEIGAEIDATIDQAFADGYKAAALRYAPDVEYWKTLANTPPADHFWEGFGWGFVTSLVAVSIVAVVVR